MAPHEAAIVVSARACVGARFRLHGRSAETGLDCVGLAAIAYGRGKVPAGYALRGGDLDRIVAAIDAAGLVRAEGARPGDLLLVEAGPYQHHLVILTDRGFVHADAGLRRVTEVPGAPPWPLIARWRAR
jgi:murein DD-endopeptidase / murein LD-carboxypeptidase